MAIKGGKRFFLFLVALFLCLSLLVFLASVLVPEKKPGRLEVSFLDVGQGDASLIETPFGQNILIDAGASGSVIKPLSKELPWWDKEIDLMVLSHPHSDHLGGMIDVLRRYKVKKVLCADAESGEADYSLWRKLVKEEGAELRKIDHPQKILLGDGCHLDILFPFSEKDISGEANLNDTSIVAKLACKNSSFLFMGDAEEKVERELAARKADLAADVLKVGHHGSDTSSNKVFLPLVGMDFAVVSVGKDNDYGHPSGRTLRNLEHGHAQILRTDLLGTLHFVSDGNGLEYLK